MGSHTPLPSGTSILAGTRSSLQLMWNLTIHPPSGPNVLADTRSSLQSTWDLTDMDGPAARFLVKRLGWKCNNSRAWFL